jgi:carboxyl-terminal processing protease
VSRLVGFCLLTITLVVACVGRQGASASTDDVINAVDLLLANYVNPLSEEELVRQACVAVSTDNCTDVKTKSDLRDLLLHQLKSGDEEEDVAIQAIDGLISELDRHTTFGMPNEGIGLLFQGVYYDSNSSGLLVWKIDHDSPAEMIGLKPGDTVTQVNGVPLTASNADQLRLRVNDQVYLKVHRPYEGDLSLTGRLEMYSPKAIESAKIGDVAYLRVNYFPNSSVVLPSGKVFITELEEGLAELREWSPSGWVLDLRGNSGGTISSAVYLAGAFGAVNICEVIRRNGPEEVQSFNERMVSTPRLVILMDGYTASAAEVVIGALEQSGLVSQAIGENTAGAVMEARAYKLGQGTLQISTGRILIGPERLDLNGVGVVPDLVVPLDADSLAEGRDQQLERALDFIHEAPASKQ